MKKELLESILNALPYEIVFCDRNHTIQYLNKTAKQHYGERIHIGDSIFNCHNQESKKKIMNFLEKQMLEVMKCLKHTILSNRKENSLHLLEIPTGK